MKLTIKEINAQIENEVPFSVLVKKKECILCDEVLRALEAQNKIIDTYEFSEDDIYDANINIIDALKVFPTLLTFNPSAKAGEKFIIVQQVTADFLITQCVG